MARTRKPPGDYDFLVLGDDPCAHLAAAVLATKGKLRVAWAALPDTQPDDRLVTVNPAVFDLHPVVTPLKKSIPTQPVYGLKFLSDSADTASEYRAKSPPISVARYRDVRDGFRSLLKSDVEVLPGKSASVESVDETGMNLTVGRTTVRAAALVVSGELRAADKTALGIPDGWGSDVVHRMTTIRCAAGKHLLAKPDASAPMSLDLGGKLRWGWMLVGDGDFQLVVEEPIESATETSGVKLLTHWAEVLRRHGVLGPKFDITPSAVRSVDLPLAGALAQEGVGNRTLLIGPAGGFYSACSEEIYPSCWSALFAVDVLTKALKEPHLQDALNPYRQKWRVTLGEYLRGPQQNLRFLLPLVYRNAAMTDRLAEAILLSKSVVR